MKAIVTVLVSISSFSAAAQQPSRCEATGAKDAVKIQPELKPYEATVVVVR